MRLLFTAVVLAVTITACGGGTAPSPARTAVEVSHTPSPTPSPTPVTLTLTQAAARYQAIVKPGNDLARGVYGHAANAYDTDPGPATIAAFAAAAKTYATTLRTESNQLRSTPWPASVQPAIDGLIKSVATDIGAANMLGAATNDDAVGAALEEFTGDGTVQAAELVREALNLPPAPTG